MSAHAIDGTLLIARLKSSALGASLYGDVTIKRPDGAVSRFGTVRVPKDVTGVMVPGTRGRFYLHDVAGTKGIAGYRGRDGTRRYHFSTFFEWFFYGIAAVDLALFALSFLFLQGRTPLTFLLLGAVTLVMAPIFTYTRLACRRLYQADEGKLPPV